MPSMNGTLNDYQVASTANGVLLKSNVYGSITIFNGEQIHFNADARDYLVKNRTLIALDSGIDPRIESKFPGLIAQLLK